MKLWMYLGADFHMHGMSKSHLSNAIRNMSVVLRDVQHERHDWLYHHVFDAEERIFVSTLYLSKPDRLPDYILVVLHIGEDE